MRKKWRVFTILFATLMVLMATGCGNEETKSEEVKKCSHCGTEIVGEEGYELAGEGILCGPCYLESDTTEGQLEDPLEGMEDILEDSTKE